MGARRTNDDARRLIPRAEEKLLIEHATAMWQVLDRCEHKDRIPNVADMIGNLVCEIRLQASRDVEDVE